MGYDKTGVTAIFYDGLPYKGKATRVFAYYGIPNVQPGQKVPGVVLVHGGGATAMEDWVRVWTAKGYAAIAMDLEGHTPDYKTHQWSGPSRNNVYDDIASATADQWMYHAGADVILANTLLRSLPNVDPTRIGVTGISWGGIITSTILGVDRRFRFAIPVYGCGYLNESETYFGPAMTSNKMVWDPSKFLINNSIPTLWVDGDQDPHFPITIFTKSYRNTPCNSNLTIYPSMLHSMQDGWLPAEIYTFADSIVKYGAGLVKITAQGNNGTNAWVSYSKPVTKAEIYYLTSTMLPYNTSTFAFTGTWTKETLTLGAGNTVNFAIPAGAKMYYVNLIDSRGLITTADLVKLN